MHSDQSAEPYPHDIVFISFSESNCDKNWLELRKRFPRAKRVHGVKGIAKAHQKAATLSETEYFFVVDGDNRIRRDFNFRPPQEKLKKDTVYVWRSFNPINHLAYGFGAIKLYNKTLLKPNDHSYVDLATTIAPNYKIIHEIASETWFFATPEEAWRGAFRECAKLAAEIIRGQKSQETQRRLDTWCSYVEKMPNCDWVLLGANQGREFGQSSNVDMTRINDFSWLSQLFNSRAL